MGDDSVKKIDSSLMGTVTPDKRGNHNNRPSISEHVKKGVREHINLFPRVPSHYCRAITNKMYLEDGLTIAKMHRLYMEWVQKEGFPAATERQYRDVLNSEFNLEFHKPKKDRCETCSDFDLKSEKSADDKKSKTTI